MSENELQGKIALVTGAGRGIGRAIALGLAREGADIILVARTESEIEEVADEVQDLGRRALTIPTDVTDPTQVGQMFDQARSDFDALHILVNNAGGGIESRSVLESDPDLWTETVEVNLLSAYRVTHALLPLLIDAKGARIINIGSGMGHRPGAGNSAYRVGKAGLWMLTQCLAEELWDLEIDVNELIPGPVATRLTEGHMSVDSPPPFAPSERVKPPDDVVPLALWLAKQSPGGGPTAQSFSLTRRPI